MKKLFNLTFCLLSVAFMPMKASEFASSQTVVCALPDFPPVLSGSVDNTIRYHFKYPAEAWKTEKLKGLDAILLIDTEGKVLDVESEMPVHPALLAEIKRVMLKTNWYPATYKDSVVCVKYHQLLNFMDSKVSQFPIGLDEYAIKAEKIVNSWEKVHELSEIDGKDIRKVEEAVDMVPEYLPTAFGLIGYFNAVGENEKAAMVADSCFKAYHSLYRSLDSFPTFVTDLRNQRLGYNGRSEIAVAMLRAMNHYISNSSERDESFDVVMSLIDDRILDGDLLENPSKSELRASEDRIQQLRRSMVEELAPGKISLSRSDELWQKVGYGYSIAEISSSLGYWSERGMIDNAMIAQLTGLIKSERDNILIGKSVNKKSINLFGVKALMLWLYKGRPVMDEYIAQVIKKSDDAKLNRYLSTLQENFRNNEDLLRDRDMVIKSLTTFIPKKSKNTEWIQLRDCRKALSKVFPVEWLYRVI